ncbi:MAG: hypothetical protein N2512_00405 [Armatimonadetes bacterium]|nr:hypothetical protein [Armatimonadota bacterium]
MGDERTQGDGLALVLHDAAVACIWVAAALYAMVLVSFGILLTAGPGMVAFYYRVWGISPAAMAIIWVSALGLLKLIALSFAAMALGLWVWEKRVERRGAGR